VVQRALQCGKRPALHITANVAIVLATIYKAVPMSLSVTGSKYICGFDEHFAIDIGYKNYRLGFKIHDWGFRFMLLWWHICWHRKIVERKHYSKQQHKVSQP